MNDDPNEADRPTMRILLIEPFDTGSHALFRETLTTHVDADFTTLTMPGRHWKWRMRGSAVWLSRVHAGELTGQRFDLILATSFLPLAEFRGLVPQLHDVPAIYYFHENQLAYPIRAITPYARDRQYGFNQLVGCLSANSVVFNSAWNRDSFLDEASTLLGKMRDCVPERWIEDVRDRSTILGVPLSFRATAPELPEITWEERQQGPLILWNHRWEHDKNPEEFFAALETLHGDGANFRLAVCGERFRRAPDVFSRAEQTLSDHIVHMGHLPRAEYEALLGRADLVVSTALHEFFGVAVLEAVHAGARPVVPDRLVYPELFPAQYRYGEDELVTHLLTQIASWEAGRSLRADRRELTDPFSLDRLIPRYEAHFRAVASSSR